MESVEEFRHTWDGCPISKEPPYGATVVVYRYAGPEAEFLVLHRKRTGPEPSQAWAWGPPSGARFPGEPVERCADRELLEETGLELKVCRIELDLPDWAVYLARASLGAKVLLSEEHDAYAWLSLDEAVERVAPEIVWIQLLRAARSLATGAATCSYPENTRIG